MKNKLYAMFAKHMEKYEMIAAAIEANIVAQIINYRNKNKLTTEDFAKKFKLSKKIVEEWESVNHDFTILEICFLFDRKIINKKVFTDEGI
jgi:DNA-binding transcriptional regulator YiaG